VQEVGWDDASAFCVRAADALGLPVRLPTESEWERAARGDDPREYPWGDAFDARCANLAEAGLGRPARVGSFPRGASWAGVLDLAGNVDEWTSDLYAPYPGASPDVPQTEPWAHDPHVTRGGSHVHHRDLARCARRHGVFGHRAGAGLRLALSL
jgi:formylglycine-generating enzyme required for sulfatase activity